MNQSPIELKVTKIITNLEKFTLVTVGISDNGTENRFHGSVEIQFMGQDYSIAELKTLSMQRLFDLAELILKARSD